MPGMFSWRPLRFSLRTLLEIVFAAGLLCWVGRDVVITFQRHHARKWLQQVGGNAMSFDEWNQQHLLQQPSPNALTVLQRWLGDEPVVQVVLPSMAPADEVEYARATFPEAQFISIAEPPSPSFF